MADRDSTANPNRGERIVADAQKIRLQRELDYRQQALKLYPWICGRCSREFGRETLHELTVHHRDHNHDHNPADGSNWELLCLYCHDNEHQRLLEADRSTGGAIEETTLSPASHKPFADLKKMLQKPGQ